MQRLLLSTLFLTTLAACASDEPLATETDTRGNYATTSSYQSSQRAEFDRAMEAGLADFDRRFEELGMLAGTQSSDALNEFRKHENGLLEKRTTLVNAMQRMEASLDVDWPDRREEVEEAFEEAREALDEAYEEVLD